MSSQMNNLSNQFNSLLTQYKQTYQDFLETINSNDNTLKTIDNSAYTSINNINTIQNSSLDNCIKSCSSNQSCSGATFDKNLNTCIISGGSGTIVNSSNKTAIVKQALYYSYQLQQINNELTQVNTSMMTLTNSRFGDYQENQKMNTEKAEILKNNYMTLEHERYQIEELIRQYGTLNSAYENGSINVTSNYYRYMMYLIMAIFLVLILIHFSLSKQQVGGANIKTSPLIYIFLALIIITNAFLKN